ncbi:MAG: coenzyme F420-0:L-glutamate ligase [Patescibacteria group bacterium]|nr:coenzyme F420-0:L-glutamate ligase [Patescibacteria group bacterium]MDD5715273.1 coenzyme F420-0:L-glutamate ligase [Patescibacteria group bacterium]
MHVQPIKTRLLKPPKDELFEVVRLSIRRVPEHSIVVIASKVISIHQGRCIPKTDLLQKDDLIQQEADLYLPRSVVPNRYAVLTIKQGILIPTAGIDESNAGGYYILWPDNPDKAARDIHRFIKKQYRVKQFGVLIVDSHTVPLRRGVVGVGLSFYGFRPVNDFRGLKDLFGRKLKITTVDVVDGLASAAVLAMGETDERTPLAMITDVPFVQFIRGAHRPSKNHPALKINIVSDLYGPLIKSVKWKKHGN